MFKGKLISLLLAVLLVAMTALPALAEEGGPEPITFTFFDKNTGDAFDNPVAKEITRRTGVTLEIMQPSADSTEKLGLMLASGDLSDFILMDRSSDMVNKYIAAGAIIPLDDLIAEHGPNIQMQYGEVLNRSRHTDGKNYYLNNWYGTDPDPVLGWLVRQDWLAEIVGDRAYGYEGFTLDEMFDIMVKFRDSGKTVDGLNTIAVSWQGDSSNYFNTLYGACGGYPYYVEDGKLMMQVRDPKFKEIMMLANKMYREGLVDVDWVTYNSDMMGNKLASGTVFSTYTAYWGVTNQNAVLRELHGSQEAQFYPYKIYDPEVGSENTTLGGRSTLGWDAICISRACKDPVRAIQFADYLASDEGQLLLMWGLEGEHWNFDAEGKRVPVDGLLDRFKTDWGATAKETGVRKWTYFIKNGYSQDGTIYDLVGKYDRTPTERFADMTLSDSHYDNDEYNNLLPEGGTDLAMIYQRMEDIRTQAFPMIVVADSEAAASDLYEKMLADLDSADAGRVEAYMSEKYFARLEAWK